MIESDFLFFYFLNNEKSFLKTVVKYTPSHPPKLKIQKPS